MLLNHIKVPIFFTTFLFVFIACDNSSTGSKEDSGPIPSENLEAVLSYTMENENGGPKGQTLLIWHDGEILLEEYSENFDGQQLHNIWSGSKSFAGLLAAIAVQNGLFTFDTALGELIPEWNPESERGKITIRQLLNLTSGIETASIGDTNQTAEEWLAADMEFETGAKFTYGPTPFYILSWIFMEVFEINPVSYLNDNLFSPLGLVRGDWSNVDLIYPNLSFGARYPALDWLQVGIMLMNKGSLNGNVIIEENLLNDLLTPSETNPGYGITFWLNTPVGQQKRSALSLPGHAKSQSTSKMISDLMPDDLFMMSGAFGQKLYICPSLNLVIVRYGVFLVGGISDEQFFLRLMEGVDQNTLE
ncbi:serine hydrolase domain-containing protein [Rhodohalobacter sulfatireducens]|uniref:Beta-lactamase family protein n=1 Tax=Rhodohalobacter sulfatireducens TaxID=2911366 RepID=A0ABS9KAN8_9BACT|nr:serine hydrolase [Rhodohalobacter sulfatireducens]MCG2587898.1 beta-lactamase family protein [Rhodohalobacter sulfatireducens]